ncbi:MAG: hypothetical protein R6X12_10535 [bacterium]
MKTMAIVAAVGLLLAVPAAARTPTSDNPADEARSEAARSGTSPTTLGPLDPIENTPELKALNAELARVTPTGDVEAMKRVHALIQELYLLSQPPQEATVSAVELPEPPAGADFVGPDIRITGGPILSTAADYSMDGTMYAACGLPDSSVRVYRSTDHGETWSYVNGLQPSPRALYRRIALCVTRGDSARIHLFLIHPTGYGDVYSGRFGLDGTYLGFAGVHISADTVGDIAFTADFDDWYYLYGTAYSTARTSGPANGKMLRSTDLGVTWAVTNTFSNLNHVSYQNGAGRWQYLAAAVRLAGGKGRINTLTNHNYGNPSSWFETNVWPDTFYVEEPVMCPAFTTPETSAVTWLAYCHKDETGSGYSIMTHYSSNGIASWSARQRIASEAGTVDAWPDLKSYHAPGNTYMNVSYVSLRDGYRRLFRRYANAPTPDNWSDTLRINSTQAFRTREMKPLLVYSPGAPATGGSCVFVQYDAPGDFVWNGPWNGVGVAEPHVPVAPPVALRVNANPVAGAARFNWDGSADALAVYDGTGRLVRRFDRPVGGAATWDRRDDTGRPVPAGIYLVRLTTDRGTATRSLVLR